jgi:hypothetical protein
VIPSDLSFGYLSAELKSPVKIPIPDIACYANRMPAQLCNFPSQWGREHPKEDAGPSVFMRSGLGTHEE